jgi:hypothetical protein
MGSQTDIVYSYAERSLRKVYPTNEGWSIQRQSVVGNSTPDFQISRKYQGVSESVIAAVIMNAKVGAKDLSIFSSDVLAMKGAGKVPKKLVIIPEGADVSSIPDDFDVIEMKGFACRENRIVWWKRNNFIEAQAE